MDKRKTCRRCGKNKSLPSYYAHKKMLDGHLNVCKECVKARVRRHREENLERIRAYDRKRGLLPHRKEATRIRSKLPEYREKHRQVCREHYVRYPAASKSRTIVSNAIRDGKLKKRPCEVCGKREAQAHHDDYLKPLDVRWLCTFHHGEWHRSHKPLNAAADPSLVAVNKRTDISGRQQHRCTDRAEPAFVSFRAT